MSGFVKLVFIRFSCCVTFSTRFTRYPQFSHKVYDLFLLTACILPSSSSSVLRMIYVHCSIYWDKDLPVFFLFNCFAGRYSLSFTMRGINLAAFGKKHWYFLECAMFMSAPSLVVQPSRVFLHFLSPLSKQAP